MMKANSTTYPKGKMMTEKYSPQLQAVMAGLRRSINYHYAEDSFLAEQENLMDATNVVAGLSEAGYEIVKIEQ